jgi:hypothetical protein
VLPAGHEKAVPTHLPVPSQLSGYVQSFPSLQLVPDGYAATHEVPLHEYLVQSTGAGHAAQTPELPHAVVVVPAWHVPPLAAEQQPPLHGWFELHAVVHLPVDASHASCAGQSAALVQPHTFDARQTCPLALFVQS